MSLRTMKDILKLNSMGYTDHLIEGWTIKQCFTHAGIGTKRKPAPKQETIDQYMSVIIYYRKEMADAAYEIKSDCVSWCPILGLTPMNRAWVRGPLCGGILSDPGSVGVVSSL